MKYSKNKELGLPFRCTLLIVAALTCISIGQSRSYAEDFANAFLVQDAFSNAGGRSYELIGTLVGFAETTVQVIDAGRSPRIDFAACERSWDAPRKWVSVKCSKDKSSSQFSTWEISKEGTGKYKCILAVNTDHKKLVQYRLELKAIDSEEFNDRFKLVVEQLNLEIGN